MSSVTSLTFNKCKLLVIAKCLNLFFSQISRIYYLKYGLIFWITNQLKIHQRTIGPVNAHLISGPRVSIWCLAKGKGTAYTFIYLFSSAYQLISRSRAAIISKESITVTFFVYKSLSSKIWPCQKIGQEKPKVITWTNYDGLESQMLHTKFHRNHFTGSGEEDVWCLFTILGPGSHLGHVTSIMLMDFHLIAPESLHIKFG